MIRRRLQNARKFLPFTQWILNSIVAILAYIYFQPVICTSLVGFSENKNDENVLISLYIKVENVSKVEKFLKGREDLIPSPSVKIQYIGGNVYLR